MDINSKIIQDRLNEEKIQKLEDEINRLNVENADLEACCDENQDKVEELEDKVIELKNKILGLTMENKKLKDLLNKEGIL